MVRSRKSLEDEASFWHKRFIDAEQEIKGMKLEMAELRDEIWYLSGGFR